MEPIWTNFGLDPQYLQIVHIYNIFPIFLFLCFVFSWWFFLLIFFFFLLFLSFRFVYEHNKPLAHVNNNKILCMLILFFSFQFFFFVIYFSCLFVSVEAVYFCIWQWNCILPFFLYTQIRFSSRFSFSILA